MNVRRSLTSTVLALAISCAYIGIQRIEAQSGADTPGLNRIQSAAPVR